MTTADVDEHLDGAGIAAHRRVSWLDAVIGRIDAAAVGRPAVFIGYAAFVLAYLHAELWLSGRAPVGTLDSTQIIRAFYVVYPIALLDYLRGVAVRAWHDYRPATDMSDAQADRFEFELIHAPAWPLVGIALIAAAVVAMSTSNPVVSGVASLTGALVVTHLVALWLAVAAVFALVYETVRMLRLVSRTVARATRVNLLKPEPLYAFSRLTLRAAIGLIAIPTFQLLVVPVDVNAQTASVLWMAMIVVAGAAAFVVPLRGIHDWIVAEKRILQAAGADRLQATLERLHAAVEANDTSVDDALGKRLASLVQERDLIARLPTWPWQAGTFRTLASAIALPVVVWLLTRLLGRVL